MDLHTATEQLRAKVGNDSGLGAVLKFDCGADGAIVIDATKVPNTLSNDASTEGDCTVALTLDTLSDLLSGNLEPVTGFMTGRFKVSGDMSVAMKLQRVV
jgi:putative sterol carrier protein